MYSNPPWPACVIQTLTFGRTCTGRFTRKLLRLPGSPLPGSSDRGYDTIRSPVSGSKNTKLSGKCFTALPLSVQIGRSLNRMEARGASCPLAITVVFTLANTIHVAHANTPSSSRILHRCRLIFLASELLGPQTCRQGSPDDKMPKSRVLRSLSQTSSSTHHLHQ